MRSYRSILIGVDFSPHSANALRQAVRMARESGADLRILHLLHHEAAAVECRREHAGITEVVRGRRVHLEHFIDEVIPDRSGLNLRIDAHLGHRFASLMEAVEEYNVDLLILGSQGQDASADRPAMGSLALACVRKAACEVLLVTQEERPFFNRIAVGVDFSPCSRRAMDKGAEFAESDQAELAIVHVYTPPWSRLAYGDRRTGVTSAQAENLKSAVELELKEFVGDLKLRRPVQLTVVEDADAIGGFLRYLKETDAHLLVVGVQGQNRQEVATLGSFAERLLLGTHTSVLTVRPEA